jgi:uncharacterized protein (TIGR02145 family)
MKKIFFLMLTLIVLGATSVNAQVTIGADANPHPGAVLDLQSNLGLKLPTVELDDVAVFQLPGTAEDAVGMMIYNNSDATIGGNGKGVYVWDGKWLFSGKSAPVEVPVTKIKITSPNDAKIVLSGSKLQLTATVEPTTASNKTLSWTIVYASDASAGSATIDATGKITGVKPGNVTARASATDGSGAYTNFTFVVLPNDEVSNIIIKAANDASSVEEFRTLQLEAVVEPISADPSIIWSVSEGGSYASVNSGTGLVTGIATGEVTIQATATDGSNISGSIVLQIVPSAPIESVTMTIGDNAYETYSFNNVVWMIQNSKEGTATYDRYNNDANRMNNYYSFEEAVNGACPQGWALPTKLNFQMLFEYLSSSESNIAERNLWLHTEVLAGWYANRDGVQTWQQWGTIGRCWVSNNNFATSSEAAYGTGPNTFDPLYAPVRCIQK